MCIKYCATCPNKDTCKTTCDKVRILLNNVTNKKSTTSELPDDFKYQFSLNPYEWPTPCKKHIERTKKRQDKFIKYLRFKKDMSVKDISIKLNISKSYIYRVLKNCKCSP